MRYRKSPKDFKKIISKKCNCNGKNVCAWCLRQEELYYEDKLEIKTDLEELFLGEEE